MIASNGSLDCPNLQPAAWAAIGSCPCVPQEALIPRVCNDVSGGRPPSYQEIQTDVSFLNFD